MSSDQILTIVFGVPTVTMLTGIFYRMGQVNQAIKEHDVDIKALWGAVNDLRNKFNELFQ